MKRRTIVAAVSAALGVGAQDKKSGGEPPKKLTPDEVREMMKTDVFFLDVREPNELEETGTLKGYVNIPLGQLESRLKEVPKDKRILVA
jgi:rhodanese-related sulfurtransferase